MQLASGLVIRLARERLEGFRLASARDEGGRYMVAAAFMRAGRQVRLDAWTLDELAETLTGELGLGERASDAVRARREMEIVALSVAGHEEHAAALARELVLEGSDLTRFAVRTSASDPNEGWRTSTGPRGSAKSRASEEPELQGFDDG